MISKTTYWALHETAQDNVNVFNITAFCLDISLNTSTLKYPYLGHNVPWNNSSYIWPMLQLTLF